MAHNEGTPEDTIHLGTIHVEVVTTIGGGTGIRTSIDGGEMFSMVHQIGALELAKNDIVQAACDDSRWR